MCKHIFGPDYEIIFVFPIVQWLFDPPTPKPAKKNERAMGTRMVMTWCIVPRVFSVTSFQNGGCICTQRVVHLFTAVHGGSLLFPVPQFARNLLSVWVLSINFQSWVFLTTWNDALVSILQVVDNPPADEQQSIDPPEANTSCFEGKLQWIFYKL